MSRLLIHSGRVIDPAQNYDQPANVLIEDGVIAAIGENVGPGDREIDASGCIVCPGFIDTHVAFREPGTEDDESVASGTAAALAGGFTSVACLPDTSPVVDNRASAEFLLLQAGRANNCRVFPLGAVTKNHEGQELAEIGQLLDGGAVALTDAKHPIANAEIMRRALEYTRMFDRSIFEHPQVPELATGGVMHEGYISTLLGLRGIPAAAEHIMVSRDVSLAALTGGRLHLMSVSVRRSIQQIRDAKQNDIHVTCDITPHHLALTDTNLTDFDSNYKVDPPLRPRDHVAALIEGLKDGTVDAISSDHQPYTEESKTGEVDLAPSGIVGLETLLPICIGTLIEPNHLTWLELISKLTIGPATILKIDHGTLAVGAAADVTIFDPTEKWTIDPNEFHSHSRNTPFGGWEVRGRVKQVLVGGEVRFQQGVTKQEATNV